MRTVIGIRTMLRAAILILAMSAFAAPTFAQAARKPAEPAIVPLIEGMAYQVIEPTSAPRGSIGQFVEFEAQLKGPDGKPISGPWFGRQTLALAKVKREYPSLARMLLLSPAGEKRRWLLSQDHVPAGAKPGSYRLELKVLGYPDLLKAPDTLNAPPATAVTTPSGLRYLVLKKGKGGPKPTLQSVITIDYTGWDRMGRMFDSSLPRGEPATFPLSALIPGWQEGVPLMSPGDTVRFWIPGALAYDPLPGDNPKGPLVFDITLHSFE